MTKTITITPEQSQILSSYKEPGFDSESELLNYTMILFQKEVQKLKELKASADMYSEIYISDHDLQELTQTALLDHLIL